MTTIPLSSAFLIYSSLENAFPHMVHALNRATPATSVLPMWAYCELGTYFMETAALVYSPAVVGRVLTNTPADQTTIVELVLDALQFTRPTPLLWEDVRWDELCASPRWVVDPKHIFEQWSNK